MLSKRLNMDESNFCLSKVKKLQSISMIWVNLNLLILNRHFLTNVRNWFLDNFSHNL